MMRFWPLGLIVIVFGGIGFANVMKAPPGQSNTALDVQSRLDRLPLVIGAWKGTVTSIPEKELKIAEAQANLSRSYVNTTTKQAVSVLILFGEPGPLGAHTPETCYEGAGFRQLGNPTVRSLSNEPAEFWTTKFETGAFPPSTVQVTWGWGTDGVWKASQNPRFDFASQRLIYKLYVNRVIPSASDSNDKDPTNDFLIPFLKELQAGLTTSNEKPGQ